MYNAKENNARGKKKAPIDRGIAIVGFALRFPGDIRDEHSLWDALKKGRSCITQIPEERWPVRELRHQARREPGRSVTFAAGVLADIEKFDADFFGISPREAGQLDPQQRLLLELAYEAMESAGIPSQSLAGSRCGVYMGLSSLEYGQQALEDMAGISAHLMTGNALSMAANRLSYVFDLHGPSLAIDTACSSSLAALHHACQAIRSGEIPVALAGGVNLLLHPYSFVGFSKASMLSSSGECRPFDAGANGYVRSEGGAVFLLKSLRQALSDGDHVHAVIAASGVNTDGARKTGITIPSVAGQADLMSDVLERSGISAHALDFIEAHGTGTAVGDPMEAASIGAVYGKGRTRPLPISSIKANLGHLEPASGMAGLAKTVIALKNRALPPAPFAYVPNPRIDFQGLNIQFTDKYTPLERPDGEPLTAAVNSFGFGGANAHVIVREFRPRPAGRQGKSVPVPPLRLSAKTDSALRALAGKYSDFLQEADPENYYNITHTAAFHRDLLKKSLMVRGVTPAEIADSLRKFSDGITSANCFLEEGLPENGHTAFIYSGNGAQWAGMGRALLEESPEFAAIMAELDADMRPWCGFSLLEALRDERMDLLDDTTISQPLLFAMQFAVTMMLRQAGVVPHAVMGHSVGEIAAAWASGALDKEQAIRVICARSQAQGLTRGSGRMAAVGLSEKAAQTLIEELGLGYEVEIAGINSPHNVTVAGSQTGLARMHAHVAEQGTFFRQLDLDYAFHSKTMDAVRGVLLKKLSDLHPSRPAEIAFISSVTGGAFSGDKLSSEYWWRNVRLPVRFQDAMTTLLRRGCRVFVEIGPHAILRRYIKECAASFNARARVLPTLLRGDDGMNRIVETVMRVHAMASGVNFKVFFPRKASRVSLPSYPWQKASYWHTRTMESHPERRRIHPLLGWPLDMAETAWENILDPDVQPWLHDHKVGGAVVFPGAGYVEMALAAAREWQKEDILTVESLDILAPLVFDGNRAQCVRCSLDPRDGHFRITSRPRLDDGEWTLHASGLVLSKTVRMPTARMAALSVETERVDGANLYAIAGELGLDYGPVFRIVESVQVAEDALEIHCGPKAQQDDGYCLPPAVLDACFHSLLALRGTRNNSGESLAFLPTATGRIDLCRQGKAALIRARARRGGPRFLSADFEIFDHSGKLIAKASECRFRAVSLMRHKESDVDSWKAVPWLSPHPGEGLSTRIPPINSLARRLAPVFAGNRPEREKWYTRTLPLLEAMVLSFALEAFSDPEMRPLPDTSYARWLERLLRGEDLLPLDGNGDEKKLLPARALWRNLMRDAPECLPQLLPLGRVGLHLKDALSGRRDGRDLLREIRGASVTAGLKQADPAYFGTRSAIKEIVAVIAEELPEGRRLRVLELSDCADDLTERLGEILAEDRFQHVLALSDPGSLEQAEARYGKNSAVIVAALDAAQGSFEHRPGIPELFDVVIIRHTLHRAANIRDALTRIRQKTAAGGLVLLAERYPDWSADFLEGLDPAWWRQDAAMAEEQASSLLSPATWDRALLQEGFVDCMVCAEPASGELAEGAYLIMAKRPQEEALALPSPSASSWLLLADAASSPLAAKLREDMESVGQRVAVSLDDEYSNAVDFANIVFMRGAEDAPLAASGTLSSLLGYVQRLTNARADAHEDEPRLWIVTKGGAPVPYPSTTGTPSPAQCAVWGFGRVVMNEHPGLCCSLVDLSAGLSTTDAAARLERELLHPDGHNEILLTPAARYLLMLREDAVEAQPETEHHERFHLDFTAPGQLRNLIWRAGNGNSSGHTEHPEPAPDEIEARVLSAGLNFRDVMLTMGLLPDYAVENGFAGPNLGMEFSGVVTKVGDGVRDFAPGDPVMGFAPSCLASHVLTRANAVTRIPEQWSAEDASTVPAVFFTAYYSLKHLAQLQPGEKVLIHGATGGVGLAAIQVASHLGAEIYATAGSDEKRDILRLLGVRHIFDSRSLAFEDDILAATNEEGVDAVLNSLAGEAMRRSIAVLKPFGRFIELGKRDFVENTTLAMRPLKDNISYFAVDADQLLTGRPQLAAKIFRELMDMFHEGIFSPLPHMTFQARQAAEAFRTMQQSRHMGKIVISQFKGLPVAALLENTAKGLAGNTAENTALDGARTWLVTGGLSGFGLATARKLAEMGARNLVLVGRRGLQTHGAEKILAEFAANGVKAIAEKCDMADAEAVAALIKRVSESLPPLEGVVHAAAVFDDRVLARLEAKSLEAVLAPKLSGAWNLHQATLKLPLKHFILYSSISAALGNPGQANYVAANTGLEGLALLRRRLGLPAACVAWGPIADAGYLERQETVKKNLEQHLGRSALTSSEALRQLGSILSSGESLHILANLDWEVTARMLPDTANSRFSLVLQAIKTAEAMESADIQTMIAGKTLSEITEIVRGLIIGEAARVLSLKAEQVDPGRTLQSLGLDSLMAVELAMGLEQRCGIHLPTMLFQDAPTIDKITTRITARLTDGELAEEEQAAAGKAMEIARRHGEELPDGEAADVITKSSSNSLDVAVAS